MVEGKKTLINEIDNCDNLEEIKEVIKKLIYQIYPTLVCECGNDSDFSKETLYWEMRGKWLPLSTLSKCKLCGKEHYNNKEVKQLISGGDA